MNSAIRSAWLISIVGGTIAAVIGGIVTFHYEREFSETEKAKTQTYVDHPKQDSQDKENPSTPTGKAASTTSALQVSSVESHSEISSKSLPNALVAGAEREANAEKAQGPPDTQPLEKIDPRQSLGSQKIESETNGPCNLNINFQFSVIEKIYYPETRDGEWTSLIETLLECKDFNPAIDAATNIYYPETRDAAYSQIVDALIDQKQFDLAFKVIDRVYYPETRDKLHKRLVAAAR